MTALQFFRSIGKRSSRDVAGSNGGNIDRLDTHDWNRHSGHMLADRCGQPYLLGQVELVENRVAPAAGEAYRGGHFPSLKFASRADCSGEPNPPFLASRTTFEFANVEYGSLFVRCHKYCADMVAGRMCARRADLQIQRNGACCSCFLQFGHRIHFAQGAANDIAGVKTYSRRMTGYSQYEKRGLAHIGNGAFHLAPSRPVRHLVRLANDYRRATGVRLLHESDLSVHCARSGYRRVGCNGRRDYAYHRYDYAYYPDKILIHPSFRHLSFSGCDSLQIQRSTRDGGKQARRWSSPRRAQFFRSVGKRSSRVAHNHDVAGSNPAAATNPRRGVIRRCHGRKVWNCRWRNPGHCQAKEQETGRKRLCTPADPSVRIAFPVARGLLLSPRCTRRDASPPGSGGLFLSGSFPCGPPLMCWTLRR